jgi:hypothetical protein
MLRTSKRVLATRLIEIRDVAHDLARELARLRHPGNGIHDMAAFIQTEAEAALMALEKSRLPSTRRSSPR